MYKFNFVMFMLACLSSYDLLGIMGVLAVVVSCGTFTVLWVVGNVMDGMRWNYNMQD